MRTGAPGGGADSIGRLAAIIYCFLHCAGVHPGARCLRTGLAAVVITGLINTHQIGRADRVLCCCVAMDNTTGRGRGGGEVGWGGPFCPPPSAPRPPARAGSRSKPGVPFSDPELPQSLPGADPRAGGE